MSRHTRILALAALLRLAAAAVPGADPLVAPLVIDVDNSSVSVPTFAWAPAVIPSGAAFNLYGNTGLWPRINDDGSLVNGGLPQAGNLSLHLEKLAADTAARATKPTTGVPFETLVNTALPLSQYRDWPAVHTCVVCFGAPTSRPLILNGTVSPLTPSFMYTPILSFTRSTVSAVFVPPRTISIVSSKLLTATTLAMFEASHESCFFWLGPGGRCTRRAQESDQ
jgi:hypothetical protein